MKRAFTGNSDELCHELNEGLHIKQNKKIIIAFVRVIGVRAISSWKWCTTLNKNCKYTLIINWGKDTNEIL
jgi:hypothetical protein